LPRVSPSAEPHRSRRHRRREWGERPHRRHQPPGGSGDARRQRSALDWAARDRVTDALLRAGIGAIKRKYDPQNLFHHNANIQPA